MRAGAWRNRWVEGKAVLLLGSILTVTFPFFGLVLCGYAVARRGWVSPETIPGLNFYVLYLALPAMLLTFSANTPITSLLARGIVMTYLLSALCMLVLTVAWSRRSGMRWNDASFGALIAAFPNSGFMGVPLLVALLGSTAAAPTIVALSLDMLVTSSVCIAMSRLDVNGAADARNAFRQALKGMAVNPLPWSIVAGSLLSATHYELPTALTTWLNLLAQSASPVALFTLGCVLARTNQQPRLAALAKYIDVGKIISLKLLLHPLLVWATGRLLMAAGLPLDPFSAMVLVLVAALPSASNVPMLAERFGADAGRLAQSVMGSTAIAFVTFTLVVIVVAPSTLINR